MLKHNTKLLEIQKEREVQRLIIQKAMERLAALDQQEYEILTETVRTKGVLLVFDADGKTIRWDGGSVVFGKKSYLFIKALFFAPKRRLKTAQLGKAVWNNDIINHNTFRQFSWHLAGQLEKTKFPYQIFAKKSKMQIKTIRESEVERPKKMIFNPEIIGFLLSVRK